MRVVLLAAAWLSDVAGSGGLYATALASGLVDIDPIVLSALNLFGASRLGAPQAVAAIALAYAANVAFKLGVVFWFDRRLALRVLWPMLATPERRGGRAAPALAAAAAPDREQQPGAAGGGAEEAGEAEERQAEQRRSAFAPS